MTSPGYPAVPERNLGKYGGALSGWSSPKNMTLATSFLISER